MVGVLDSGVGGLSVWKELIETLPNEKYVYVADSGHCPYGPRAKSYIIERTFKISEFLIEKGADIIVVACNTATAAAIESLRSNFDIPFVGMEPAIKPAALHSETGVIAVLATQGTFKGELYIGTLNRFASGIKVIETVGTGLVELVEKMEWDTPEAEALLRKYIEPVMAAGADHLVLGCTHYPFLTGAIEKIVEGKMKIINPAPAVARRAKAVMDELVHRNIYREECDLFYTTGSNIQVLDSIVESIMAKSSRKEFGKYNCATIKL